MLFQLTQHARPSLPGPAFLDLLTQFPSQPLAVLHSGHNQGFSVIARKPLLTIVAADEHSRLKVHTARHLPDRDHYESLTNKLEQWESILYTPRLYPHHPLTGWIGHISYDIARKLENIGSHATDDLHCPLLYWQLFEEYFLFDHTTHTWSLIATSWPGGKNYETTFDEMHTFLSVPRSPAPPPLIPPAKLLTSMPREQYLQKVQRIKDYIAAGDIYQANFAQRWTLHTSASPIDIFRQLMFESPSQYAALLITDPAHGPPRAAISASPELLLHRHGNHLTTQPIKGTRPRDLKNPLRDAELYNELLHSEKDKAELTMIVDLLRNDLGRIAQFGSVKVSTPREIQQLPTLWHAVATIEADLSHPSDHTSFASIIRAIMPGGSITGAPKIRAMQIIEQLEPTRRGLYCGAIGAISPSPAHPTATLNIAIRTIQLINQTAHLHAGGGIVADSNPQQEYEESQHKAAALFRALGLNPQ